MPIFNYVSSPFLCVVIHLQHRMAIQDKSSGIAGCVRGALLNYFGFVQGKKSNVFYEVLFRMLRNTGLNVCLSCVNLNP